MMMWRSYLGSNVTSIRNIIFLDVKVATFFVPRNDPCDVPRRSSSDRANTHILCLFMKKRPWRSLLLEEVHFSLMSIM